MYLVQDSLRTKKKKMKLYYLLDYSISFLFVWIIILDFTVLFLFDYYIFYVGTKDVILDNYLR